MLVQRRGRLRPPVRQVERERRIIRVVEASTSKNVMVNPNRHRAESKATRVAVIMLLIVSALLTASQQPSATNQLLPLIGEPPQAAIDRQLSLYEVYVHRSSALTLLQGVPV